MSFEITDEDRKSPFFALGRVQAILTAHESDTDKLARIKEAVEDWESRNPNIQSCE